MRSRLPDHTDLSGEEPIYNCDGWHPCTEGKDTRLSYGCLQLNRIYLPLAVREKLGYTHVETVADWIKCLPIAKRINWEKSEEVFLAPKTYTSAVPLKEGATTASVHFNATGNADESWIHLSYSLDGKNIGEAVVTYNFKGIYTIVSGRVAEQNKYGVGEECLDKVACIEPLQENWDEESIAKATFVTINIKLDKYPYKPRDENLRTYEQERRRKDYPVVYPTELHRNICFGGYDGAFTLSSITNMAVTSAVGVDFSNKKNHELGSYFDKLCANIDKGLDAAITAAYGPTAETVLGHMKKKFPELGDRIPKVIHLARANIPCLDYTHQVCRLRDSDGKVCVKHPSRPPLATQVHSQKGNWWENYPQIIRFYTDADKHLPATQRQLAIFNYLPELGKYERLIMTYMPTQVSNEELF